MPLSTTLSQTSLAATILVSTIGTYIALTPPNNQENPISSSIPTPSPSPTITPTSANDTIHWLNLTNKHIIKILLAPFGLLALHTSILAFFYPNIPSFILGHATLTNSTTTTTTQNPKPTTAKNPLNPTHLTWTPQTTLLPLLLNLLLGIPLRLHSYTTLGPNFTFNLTKPSSLQTTGIYKYVQHPSYTGLVIIVVSNLVLLGGGFGGRDGVLGCWVPPRWLRRWRNRGGMGGLGVDGVFAVLGVAVMMGGVGMRVREEEAMLRGEFGGEWEAWHARTARFIPWVF